MTHPSLKLRLRRYFEKNPERWFAKGVLCDLARDKTGATGEHTGRRLRELENEGLVEVRYKKNHAYYRLKSTVADRVQHDLDWFEELSGKPMVKSHS